MLEYRKHYNKPILQSMSPTDFRDVTICLQMSTYEFFVVRYDGEDGYTQRVSVLVDSKTKLRDETNAMSRLNGKNRRDLLRLWLKWDRCHGKVLKDDEIANLIASLIPICHRYNNVIVTNNEYEMTFEDIKDFSKRKLRIQSTHYKGPEYYRPDLLSVYEERLEKSIPQLDALKRQMTDSLDGNRSDQIIPLAHKVTSMMQLVEHDRRYVEELREAMRYIETQ